MTPPEGTDVTDAQPSDDRGRQTLALILAAVLGVVVVGAVLFVTLNAGDEPAPTADGQTVVTEVPVTVTLPSELEEPIVVPEGDYTEFCAELGRQTAEFGTAQGIEQIRTLYRDVDFDQLIPLAPEGLQPDLVTIRDDRDEVLTALEQIDDITDLGAADLPAGFLRAAATLSATATQECLPPS